ncbi:MAG: helix-turn-helix domain-containing protein, partial [Rhodospirillales bacterium]|nr:helix-turn-helix domain-containing protein [Rhodospirillales bacterium]
TGITASCGVRIQREQDLSKPEQYDYIVVCGGLLHRGEVLSDGVRDFLHAADKVGVTLIGLCTGSLQLARAGLMAGRRCCISWFHYRELAEELLGELGDVTPVADQLFVVDGRRITCAAGLASADLAAWLIEGHFGRARAQKSLHILGADHARAASDPQPHPPLGVTATNDRVRRATILMEQHLSNPLPIEEIANRVNISRRQLDRVFRQELNQPPQVFYRALRLEFARHLLSQGKYTVTDVAMECGFSDAAHFSRLFKEVFGHSPSQESANALAGNSPAGNEHRQDAPVSIGPASSKLH